MTQPDRVTQPDAASRTSIREQTSIAAYEAARQVLEQHAIVLDADDPDTCILLPVMLEPTRPLIRIGGAGGVKWSLRRALMSATDDERVIATCRNRLCCRVDHLKCVSKRKKKTKKRTQTRKRRTTT